MTLDEQIDEQIEWLRQKANDSYELAKAYLSNHDTKNYAKYSDMADDCQLVIDNLESFKKNSRIANTRKEE